MTEKDILNARMPSYEELLGLWKYSGYFSQKMFINKFGEVRGNDLWEKYKSLNEDVLCFFFRECNRDEVEKLIC